MWCAWREESNSYEAENHKKDQLSNLNIVTFFSLNAGIKCDYITVIERKLAYYWLTGKIME